MKAENKLAPVTMKIYRNRKTGGPFILHVTPGIDHPENAEWIDQRTKKPVMQKVMFIAGEAKVPCALGRYLIDKGYANASPLIIPIQAKRPSKKVDLMYANA